MYDVNSDQLNRQPLLGLRVMVTRPEVEKGTGPICRDGPPGAPHKLDLSPFPPADPLAAQLCQLGAEVIVQPAIRIAPPADWRPVDEALARLGEFDWLVFSSANGVRCLLDRMQEKGQGSAALPVRCKVAAMGPGTAEELTRYGLHADLVPGREKGTGPICRDGPSGASHKLDVSPFFAGEYRAEALADALAREAPGRRFLLARASRGREILAEQLVAAGGAVEQIVVYLSTDVEEADAAVAAALRDGRIDWITVTSSAIARSLARMFGEDLRRAKLASISPISSATIRELGYEPAAEAGEYTLAGVVAAIVRGLAHP
jgi:uroporphyrinogen III methyltransferase / synthase